MKNNPSHALRYRQTAVSGATRQKQIPDRTTLKNRILPVAILGLAVAGIAPQAKAAVLVQFNFNAENFTASTVASGISLTDFNAGAPVDNLVFGNGAAGAWGDARTFAQPGISGLATDFFLNSGGGDANRFTAFTLTYTGTDSVTLDSFTFNSRDTFGADNGFKLQYKLGLASAADRTIVGPQSQPQTTTDITGSTRTIINSTAWQSPSAIDLTGITLADRTLTNGEEFSVYFVNSIGNNTWSNDNFTLNGTIIPEPSTYAMVGLGVLGFCLRRKNRKD